MAATKGKYFHSAFLQHSEISPFNFSTDERKIHRSGKGFFLSLGISQEKITSLPNRAWVCLGDEYWHYSITLSPGQGLFKKKIQAFTEFSSPRARPVGLSRRLPLLGDSVLMKGLVYAHLGWALAARAVYEVCVHFAVTVGARDVFLDISAVHTSSR